MIKTWGILTKLKEENRIMKVVVLVLALSIFLEGVLIYRAATTQKIVVIPPGVNREFWVAGDSVSQSYLEQVALYIVDRIVSVSPENVDYSFNSIMPFFTTEPQAVKKIKDTYIEFARGIKTNNVYQMFYPLKVVIKGDEITVDGTVKKLTGNILMSEGSMKVIIKYVIKNGRFLVTVLNFEGGA